MAQEQAKVFTVHRLTSALFLAMFPFIIHSHAYFCTIGSAKQVDEVIDLMKCNVEKVLERDEGGGRCSGAAAFLTFSDRRSLNFSKLSAQIEILQTWAQYPMHFYL